MQRNKQKTSYQCTDCGAVAAKWSGQCADCGTWNTLQEILIDKPSANAGRFREHLSKPSAVCSLAEVENEEEARVMTGISELDRVLGGGLVKGSVTLIGGDPGIGKSTLLLQMLASLLNVPLLWLIAGSQQVPDPTAGITKEEMVLQKIADLDSIIDLLKSDLDELRVLAGAGD